MKEMSLWITTGISSICQQLCLKVDSFVLPFLFPLLVHSSLSIGQRRSIDSFLWCLFLFEFLIVSVDLIGSSRFTCCEELRWSLWNHRIFVSLNVQMSRVLRSIRKVIRVFIAIKLMTSTSREQHSLSTIEITIDQFRPNWLYTYSIQNIPLKTSGIKHYKTVRTSRFFANQRRV